MSRVPTRLAAAALLALLAGGTLLPAAPAARGACGDPEEVPGLGTVCRRGDGLLEIVGRDGASLGLTHGPDPRPAAGESASAAATPRPPRCTDADPLTYTTIVIYARAVDDADAYNASVPTIRNVIAAANGLVVDAAASVGGRIDVRVVCSGGVIEVRNAVLPTPRADADFESIVSDLRALGYTNGRWKHWVYYDDREACTCAGVGHVYGDDRPGADNLNNGNGVPMFAVSFGYADTRTFLHELAHNMGAVQLSAPHTTGAYHCIDGRDVMCYNDGGPQGGRYSTSACGLELFDCGRDDYFHPRPAAGSYLATHWNLASEHNRFLEFGTPILEWVACDASVVEDRPARCSMFATDDSPGVAYDVDWGDGTRSRIPPSGYEAPGEAREASHVYASPGSYVVTLSVTDDGVPPATSPPHVAAVTVTFDGTPVLEAFACPLRGARGIAVECAYRATDDTPVAYTIDWGDGTTLRDPPAGHVAPGEERAASHAYAQAATVTVVAIATDDAPTPHPSEPVQTTLEIIDDTTPPTVALHDPRPSSVYRGCGLRLHAPVLRPAFVEQGCVRLDAEDDVAGVRAARVYLDGVLVGERTIAPYVFEFPTHGTLVDSRLRIEVEDSAGNVARLLVGVDGV